MSLFKNIIYKKNSVTQSLRKSDYQNVILFPLEMSFVLK